MTRTLSALIGVLLLATVAAAAQQTRDASAQPAASAPAGTATVGGAVIDDRGQPVRRARVTINPVDRSSSGRTATTDDGGRFAVRRLPAGRYNVQASKRAWLDANLGATRPGRAGTAVVVADGQQLTNLRITMTRGAVITGTVRGDNGDPVRNLGVTLFQFSLRSGIRSLSPAGSATTDDLGVYRLWGLSPGDYIVMASGPTGASMAQPVTAEIRQTMPGDVERAIQTTRAGSQTATGPGTSAPVDSTRRGAPVNYAPVFFPGTTDASNAETLHLAVAEERASVDLEFRLIPTRKVEGSIVSPPDVAITSYQLRMLPLGDEFNGVASLGIAARPDRSGHFVIPSVAPGRYTLQAAGAAAPPPSAAPNAPPRQLAGFATVDVVVVDQDVTVAMALQPPVSLKARLVFDGANPPKDAAGFQISVLNPIERGQLLQGIPAGPSSPLTLTFPPLPPGRYSVFFNSPRATPWIATSAMTGGRDALDAPIDARGEMDDLVVTFTDHPSEIAGKLQDTAGRPATDYFVIVFPADKALWTPTTRRIQSVRPGNDGAFTVKGLPAGDYFVGALTDVEPGEWFQPAFLDEIARGAQKISVTAGQKTSVTLKIAGGGD